MIFGKTKVQKAEEEHLRCRKIVLGRRRFAFFPVELHDGRYIWLEWYWSFPRNIGVEDGLLYDTKFYLRGCLNSQTYRVDFVKLHGWDYKKQEAIDLQENEWQKALTAIAHGKEKALVDLECAKRRTHDGW